METKKKQEEPISEKDVLNEEYHKKLANSFEWAAKNVLMGYIISGAWNELEWNKIERCRKLLENDMNVYFMARVCEYFRLGYASRKFDIEHKDSIDEFVKELLKLNEEEFEEVAFEAAKEGALLMPQFDKPQEEIDKFKNVLADDVYVAFIREVCRAYSILFFMETEKNKKNENYL